MSWARVLGALSVMLWMAPGAVSAEDPAPDPAEAEAEKGPDYARNGFYLAVGGLWARPIGWDGDIQRGFKKRAEEQGQANAEANAEAIIAMQPPPRPQVAFADPLGVTLNGVGLNDGAGGFGGSIGYRFAPRAALEVEGEWVDDMKSSFKIKGTSDKGTVNVTDLWTLTANLRAYGLIGRFQPFGVVGLGVTSARVKMRGASDQLTTTVNLVDTPPLEDVPAPFEVSERGSTLDGALRVGGGVDVYVTEHVVAEVKTDYVVPFVDTTFFSTDYLSVRLGVLFRF